MFNFSTGETNVLILSALLSDFRLNVIYHFRAREIIRAFITDELLRRCETF